MFSFFLCIAAATLPSRSPPLYHPILSHFTILSLLVSLILSLLVSLILSLSRSPSLSIYLSPAFSLFQKISLPLYLFLSIYLSIYLSISLSHYHYLSSHCLLSPPLFLSLTSSHMSRSDCCETLSCTYRDRG